MIRLTCQKKTSLLPHMVAVLVAVTACATNPATGERQLSLISETQEIEMGRQGVAQVEATIGAYQDADLDSYVETIGLSIAARTERPNLPWSFQVADDPTVNAFALPGGFIYVTRGILAHFNSEAELAAVLGHEIGHVTARHSVEQMSRAQLAGLGLGVGSILFDEVRQFGGLLGTGVGLLFLKYGRDDETQSDALGVRYMLADNYDPREALDVFRMLDRLSDESGSGLPSWLSTHPSPADRLERIQAQIDAIGESRLGGTTIDETRYIRRLDGLVFGTNPRNGFSRGGLFLHPELAFQVRFPDDWDIRNFARAVFSQSPDGNAILQLTIAGETRHETAAEAFFSEEGIAASRVHQARINGLPATTGHFVARTRDATLEGEAAFLEFGGHAYQLLGFADAAHFGRYADSINAFVASFDRLEDREALAAQPLRIDILTLNAPVTIEALARSRKSPVSIDTLALLNGVGRGAPLPAGRPIKWVIGERVS